MDGCCRGKTSITYLYKVDGQFLEDAYGTCANCTSEVYNDLRECVEAVGFNSTFTMSTNVIPMHRKEGCMAIPLQRVHLPHEEII